MDFTVIASKTDIETGLDALCAADPRLAEVRRKAGSTPLRRQDPGFAGLAQIIVAQMVSKASAAAIWGRLADQTGDVAPARVAALTDQQCRAIGLSRSKENTLRAAANAVLSGALDPQDLCRVPAEEAIAAMIAIKGIGRWTAEVYLLFCAGHADIFPAGDVALQSAVAHALRLADRPTQKQLYALSEEWSPWRGVAARLFWAYYANEMRRADVIPA